MNECARAGVRYAIEPHLDSISENVDGTRAFLDASEWLTLTLDYGHFITSGETSEQVHTLLRFASHVHAREAPSEDSKPRLMKTQSTFPACWLDFKS